MELAPSPQAFPDHNIDPRLKIKPEFMLQMSKACLSNWQLGMPAGSLFLAKAARYAEIRDYAMGRQSIDKHKKELLPEDENDESYTKISWEPRTDGMVLRNIAVAKLQKAGVNVIATAINPMAKDAQDAEYAKAKAKIMLRQAVSEQMPEATNHPMVRKMPGEADTLDDLKMEINFSPKFVRSKDIEESVDLVWYENDMTSILDATDEDVVDFGVGIIKDDIDENNKVILERVYPGEFACSATKRADFADVTWAFRVRSNKVSDIAKKDFTEQQITDLINRILGKNGNPTALGSNLIEDNGYDIFKCDVMDLEFISWDRRVTESNKDKLGNLKVSKAKPSAAEPTYVDNDGNVVVKKQKDSEFTSRTIEKVYKCKWIIGTDMIFDYGLADNQKRNVTITTMAKTKLSYHIKAASFHNMRATGLTEAMIPIIDDLNITNYKLRMFKNMMVPNGFDIDLSAIESVALGAKGQDNMTPREVINMFFETGVLVSRRSGISMDSNVNYKAINSITNGMADQLVALAQDLQNNKQALRDITGLNELTDGSTPNPKTLTTIANLANESTNNALWYLINCRRKLIESTAKGTVQRLQVAKRRGPYDGFNRLKGRWITVPDSINDYDYDIMIEDKPTEEQKQVIFALMEEDIKAGYISHADVTEIIYSHNLKRTAILLSYRVEQGKAKQQAAALQNTQATAQAQITSNQAAEQFKLKMDTVRHKQKMEEIDLGKSWDYLIMEKKVKQQDDAAQMKADTEIAKVTIANNADQGAPDPSGAPDSPQPQQPVQ